MITQAVLPPGGSKERFKQALSEFRAALGVDQVYVELDRILSYTKVMMPVDEALHQPSGVLVATTVEQIQKVLAICNRYGIPIWTISTGRNFGYGSAAPITAGQMVLDLRRMDRILEVDHEMGTILVEPGVTYQQIQDYLDEHNLPYWLSFPSSGPIVGPVGNVLDHGMGANRYGENMVHFCGMEVVLADGQVVRTGMGGVANAKTWQSYRWGFGPWIDGLFCQSNMGIVTKMGFWLMAKPEASLQIVVMLNDDDSYEKAIDQARRLRFQGVIENCMTGDALYGLMLTTRRSQIKPDPGPITQSFMEELTRKTGAPARMVETTLYGTREQLAVNLAIVRKAFAGLGMLVTSDELGDKLPFGFKHMLGYHTGVLNLDEFGAYNFRGGGGSSWFAPVVQAKGSEVLRYIKLARPIFEEYGFDITCGGLMGYSGRHFDFITELLFDRTNPEEMKRAYDCFKKLVEVNGAAGFAPYRVNTAFQKQVADLYGPAQQAINRRLKRALDPNNILAPGKSGITLR